MEANALGAPASVAVHVQSRIFEAVASGDLPMGTVDALARRFGVTPEGFLACLDGLVQAGWVTVRADPDGRCSVELEP